MRLSELDFSSVWDSAPSLWHGLQYSVSLTAVATSFGVVIGTLLAMARLSSHPWLNRPASVYVNLFRSVPLLFVILFLYILLPMVTGLQMGADKSAYITFSVFEAAYFCEIVRAGIQSIAKGQIGAGQALGFTYGQNMRYVILPQAFRNVVPLLLTQTIILFQDTSLVYVVGASDLLHAATRVVGTYNNPVEMYLSVALIYFTISFTLSRLVKNLHGRIAIIR
jgi:glutamate/aspartate transport system permease protein